MKKYVVKYEWKEPHCHFTITLMSKEVLSQEAVHEKTDKFAKSLDGPADIVVTYKVK